MFKFLILGVTSILGRSIICFLINCRTNWFGKKIIKNVLIKSKSTINGSRKIYFEFWKRTFVRMKYFRLFLMPTWCIEHILLTSQTLNGTTSFNLCFKCELDDSKICFQIQHKNWNLLWFSIATFSSTKYFRTTQFPLP